MQIDYSQYVISIISISLPAFFRYTSSPSDSGDSDSDYSDVDSADEEKKAEQAQRRKEAKERSKQKKKEEKRSGESKPKSSSSKVRFSTRVAGSSLCHFIYSFIFIFNFPSMIYQTFVHLAILFSIHPYNSSCPEMHS